MKKKPVKKSSGKKGIWIVIGIILIAAFFSGSTTIKTDASLQKSASPTNNPGPTPTVIPEWEKMSYEEKVEYYNDSWSVFFHETEGEHKKEEELTYSSSYMVMVEKTLKQIARDKYDAAYKRNLSKGAAGNPEYYLIDFDNNELMLLRKSKYGRHYGSFTVLENGDYEIQRNEDSSIVPYSFRLADDRIQFIDETDGSIIDNVLQCDIEEPLKYILHRKN